MSRQFARLRAYFAYGFTHKDMFTNKPIATGIETHPNTYTTNTRSEAHKRRHQPCDTQTRVNAEMFVYAQANLHLHTTTTTTTTTMTTSCTAITTTTTAAATATATETTTTSLELEGVSKNAQSPAYTRSYHRYPHGQCLLPHFRQNGLRPKTIATARNRWTRPNSVAVGYLKIDEGGSPGQVQKIWPLCSVVSPSAAETRK